MFQPSWLALTCLALHETLHCSTAPHFPTLLERLRAWPRGSLEGSRSVTLTDDYHFELREIIYYYTGMNFDGRFGELGDGEHMARVGEHARPGL